jgi:single-strand DNA-binding protein
MHAEEDMVETDVTTSAGPGPEIEGDAARSGDSNHAHTGESVLAPVHPGDRNEVHLIGRLAAPVESRTLPSGAMIAIFRLIVRRPPPQPRPAVGRTPTVDVIDCVAWTEPLQQSVARYRAGDMIEVAGALRRRFWRTPGPGATGPASRCEVELTSASQLGTSS